MFCHNCGKQVNDGAGFCPYCGTRLNQAPQQGQYRTQPQNDYRQQQQQYNQYSQMPPYDHQGAAVKQVNKKLPLIIGIVAAAAAVALILIFVVFKPFGGGSTGSPEGTLKKLETALNELDVEGIIECCDSEIREEADNLGLYTTQIEQAKSYIDMLGADFNFTFNGYNYEYIVEDGVQYCTCDVDMSYRVSMLGQEQSGSDSMTLVFVNENGQWLLSGDESFEEMIGELF